ncbi:MAG: hypothetical protein WBW41_07615 [Verrucomicrobiia bacterium]
MNLVFSSKVQKQSREAVENLFFLNPRQYRVRDGITDALQKFGHPRLEEKDDNVYLRVGDGDAQTLFAFDGNRPGGDPVGVVVFLRNSPTEIIIVHMAVQPDYALQGKHAGLGLGLALIEKVREIASRIVGVQRIVFFYRPEVVIRL